MRGTASRFLARPRSPFFARARPWASRESKRGSSKSETRKNEAILASLLFDKPARGAIVIPREGALDFGARRVIARVFFERRV
jgi:hypothetical protein